MPLYFPPGADAGRRSSTLFSPNWLNRDAHGPDPVPGVRRSRSARHNQFALYSFRACREPYAQIAERPAELARAFRHAGRDNPPPFLQLSKDARPRVLNTTQENRHEPRKPGNTTNAGALPQ